MIGFKSVVAQQLTGYIYLLKGNQMPSPGRPISKGRGVNCELLIYAPTTIAETTGSSPLFTSVKTKLIGKIKSDSTGYYAINLLPGKYSVFIAEKGSLFAAESDGSGTLNPVAVYAEKPVVKDFTITLNAAF